MKVNELESTIQSIKSNSSIYNKEITKSMREIIAKKKKSKLGQIKSCSHKFDKSAPSKQIDTSKH